jgi:Na+-transporting NADH:ubiquinone oxidoreductase subunit E
MAILAMAGIRQEKLNAAKLPAGLEGPGITLIVAGIMALAFMGFNGMISLN